MYSDLNIVTPKINRKSTTNELIYDSFKISKDNILERLQTLLCINKVKATEILTNCKPLSKVSPKLLTDNYEICKVYGITNESLTSFPELLTQKDLPEKLHLINNATNDVNSMISLLKMNFNNLSKTVCLLDKENDRVQYFSKLFNVKPLQICEYIKKKPFLLKLNLERIQESLRLLTDNGISKNEVLSDLWVLNYKLDTVKKRIKFVKENKFEKIKTWMIRAPSDIILKTTEMTWSSQKSDGK
ncbi:mTERF [Popillia japonica]|uniref:mTERF n=1 Tax=Popillia japonica TaxID=7064 RepID=A0AAW1JDG0_POPJA